ncbi:hypothetical protein [Agrobacterium tumefaciens]|nr:hypothetical protein [Agrobacterium tumefaciens]
MSVRQLVARFAQIAPLARTAIPARFNQQAIESYGVATGADRA